MNQMKNLKASRITQKRSKRRLGIRWTFANSNGSVQNGLLGETERCDEAEQQRDFSSNSNNNNNNEPRTNFRATDEDGLILPRKLINPCTESTDCRELHRELRFNDKMGRNVLNQKSELQRALEKHRKHADDKQTKLEKMAAKTSLEKALEERARRLEQLEKNAELNENTRKVVETNEFLQVHARLRRNAVHV